MRAVGPLAARKGIGAGPGAGCHGGWRIVGGDLGCSRCEGSLEVFGGLIPGNPGNARAL